MSEQVLPTFTDIRGKQYETVDSRVRRFRADHLAGVITTEVVHIDDTSVLCKASISIDGNLIATGVAEEFRGSSNINQTSAVENCETSAVGRALGFAGYDAAGSIASADEVARAINQQSSLSPPSAGRSPSAPQGLSPGEGGRPALPAGKVTVTIAGAVEDKEIKKKDGTTTKKYVFQTTDGYKFFTWKRDVAVVAEEARRAGKDVELEHQGGNDYGEHQIKWDKLRAVDAGSQAEPEPVQEPVEAGISDDDIPF